MGDNGNVSGGRGSGFDNADVAYSAIGIMDVCTANEQIKNTYSREEAKVYFICANVAAAKIRDKRYLYNTFSRDELDLLLFYCMKNYVRVKERHPYDGSIPFEAYVVRFVLAAGRQEYARSQETDNEHVVATSKNRYGEKSTYGRCGKYKIVEPLDATDDIKDDGCFEDIIINRVDADNIYLDKEIVRKMDKLHPLLKIVFKHWINDCKNEYVPFYTYATDERVLSLAATDERCAKYLQMNAEGNLYLNPSTLSKLLYKFQKMLTKADVCEITRFNCTLDKNPYFKTIIA